MLTAKDVEFYKAQGYVVARDVLSAAECLPRRRVDVSCTRRSSFWPPI